MTHFVVPPPAGSSLHCSLARVLGKAAAIALASAAMMEGSVVQAQRASVTASTTEDLKEIVVTAPGVAKKSVVERLDERRLKSSGSVEVVKPKELKLQSTNNLGEVLVRIPSVQYIDEDGRGTKPNIGIRGLNPQRSQFTQILHDGVPVQPSLYSENAGYYGVPAERVGGIEVIKGGASLRHGPHAVGGIVNFLSRDISLEPFAATLDSRIDSNGSYRGNIALHGTIDRLQYSFEYLHSGGEGFRDNLDSEIDDFDVRLAYDINDVHRVIAHFAHYDEHSQTPGGLTSQEFANDPHFSSKPNDVFLGNRVAFDIRSISQFDENNRLELLFFTSFFERDWYLQNYVAPNGTSNALANSNEQALRDFTVYGFEPKYTLKYTLGAWENNELAFGGRFYKDEATRRTKTGLSGNAREDNANLTAEDHLSTTVWAAWVDNRLQLTEKFSLNTGVRYENIQQTRVDVFNRRPEQGLGVDVWLPSFGALYTIKENFVAFANASRSFAPPSFGDSFNPTILASSVPLQASAATTYEIGVRGKPLLWLTSDLSLFYTDFKNQVVVTGATVANFDTITYGLESSFEVGLNQLAHSIKGLGLYEGGSEVTLLFGGTFLDSTINSGPFDGKQVPYVATAVGVFGIQYDYKDIVNVRLQGRYVSDQFADVQNTVGENANATTGELNAYTTFDLKAAWKVNDTWTLKAGVINLLDETYGTQRRTGTQRGIFPGVGRTAHVGVTMTF